MTYPFEKEATELRKTHYSINPLITSRWSPRSMTGESINDAELFALFEAARWAPSSYNNQPWRFFYAKRETPLFSLYFDLLVEPNQVWCKDAAVLLCIVSKTLFDHNQKPCRTHSFDTGAAWILMALEGAARGLVVHGMEGFNWKKAAEVLELPDGYSIEAMAAIGRRGEEDHLPEKLRQIEKPSSRKEIEEIAFEGKFPKAK